MNEMLMMVYGTLMTRFHNNILLEEQTLLGECETKEKYTMFVNSIPYVYPHSETSTIKGELWKVTGKQAIDRLDSLEGHPDWYNRREIIIIHNGEEKKAWLYFMPDESVTSLTIIKNGDYRYPEYLKNETLIVNNK